MQSVIFSIQYQEQGITRVGRAVSNSLYEMHAALLSSSDSYYFIMDLESLS